MADNKAAYLTGSEVVCGPVEVSAADVPLRTVGYDSRHGYVVARLNAGGVPCWIPPGWMHGTGRPAYPLIARAEEIDRLSSENAALREAIDHLGDAGDDLADEAGSPFVAEAKAAWFDAHHAALEVVSPADVTAPSSPEATR